MRTHAFLTIVSGLALLSCVGCSMTDTGSTVRGQAPGGYCDNGTCLTGNCNDGSCFNGGCFNGNCFSGNCNDGSCNPWGNGSADHGWFKDKWSQSNVHHYNQSMVPQCNVGTAMPMMVQYPYYANKGPDCFFYGGD